MSKDLHTKHCVPCEGNTPPLTHPQNVEYLQDLNTWNLIEDTALEKKFLFKNFAEALAFVNKVGVLAEKENHHPDIEIYGWNKVRIHISTHAIDGLSENDFIIASKIDQFHP